MQFRGHQRNERYFSDIYQAVEFDLFSRPPNCNMCEDSSHNNLTGRHCAIVIACTTIDANKSLTHSTA